MTHRTLEQIEKLMKSTPAGKVIPVTEAELTMISRCGYSIASFELINKLQAQEQKSEGSKFDSEKPRMDLLDSYFLEGVASVLTFGASKYSAHNWRKGIPLSRLIAAAYRHLGAFNNGEDLDPESGKNHLFHLGCCIMFAAWTHKFKPELDDRYKQEENKDGE